jgi:hypothetical protein
MPKIQNVARFTTRVKPTDAFFQSLAPQEETVMPQPQAPALTKLALDVLEQMRTQTQPLSVTEIMDLLTQNLQRKFHDSAVRYALADLIEAGKLFDRTETTDERSLRAADRKIRNIRAKLYSIQSPVQPRTVLEAVPGSLLHDSFGIPWSKKKAKAKADIILEEVDVVSIPTLSMAGSPVIDMLIEKIVAERTKEVIQELEKVQTELARLKDFLKSAL